MKAVLQKITASAAGALQKLGDAGGALLFLGLFSCLIVQVITRFVLDRPAAWTEELAAISFLWVIFWGAAFATPLAEHVAIDLFEARFGQRVQRISEAIGLIVISACFVWALPGVIDYVVFMQRERTPVTNLRFSWVFSVFIAFMLMLVLRCCAAIIWPSAHRPVPPEIEAP